MSINLTRDSSGRILSNGAPIILRGGHYHLFKDNDRPERCLAKPAILEPQPPVQAVPSIPLRVVYNGVEPCQVADPDLLVEEKYWSPEPWSIFAYMKQYECNFLRIWLTGGTAVGGGGADPKPLDLTPFVSVQVGGKWKWQVYNAVVNGVWNNEYFRRLNAFVTAAENAGVVVQISLFNYLDLITEQNGNFRTWCRSPWNSTLSDHPASVPNWGKDHLVNAGNSFSCIDADTNATVSARHKYFLAPNNYLRKVQQALVTKTVKTLINRTNVIYEIMNEPRGNAQQRVNFCSTVAGWILSAAGTKRPLISINTSNANDGIFDIDYWRNNSLPNYDKIDAVSYHGLTGYPETEQTVCCKPARVWAVDLKSVQSRFNAHQSRHGGKSLIYCTDAVIMGLHTFNDKKYDFRIRDGQIYTNYPNVNQDSPEVQRIKSDLQNWAFWCFSVSVAYPGEVHFQNHSLNQVAYNRIKEAMDHARALP